MLPRPSLDVIRTFASPLFSVCSSLFCSLLSNVVFVLLCCFLFSRQRGHKDHAALWDTTAWREFVATAGDHRVEFDMCFFDNDHAESAHTATKRTTRLASDAKTHSYLVLKFGQRWCNDKHAHNRMSNSDTTLSQYFNHELLGAVINAIATSSILKVAQGAYGTPGAVAIAQLFDQPKMHVERAAA